MSDTRQDGIPEGSRDGTGDRGGQRHPATPEKIQSPISNPGGTFSDEITSYPDLGRVKCHRCGRYRYVMDDDLVRARQGESRCKACYDPHQLEPYSGESLIDGFGGIGDVPPEADFLHEVEDRNLRLVLAMAGAGVDVHCQDEKALRYASARGDLDAVKLLLELGADPAAMGNQAIKWAYDAKHQEVVDLLIDYGADAEVLHKDHEEETPKISSGTTWNSDGHRWFGCPICHVYVDALVDGKLIDADRISCPLCGCLELNVDSGGPGGFKPGVAIVPAKITRGELDPNIIKVVKEARAMLTEAGMFSADDNDEEPKWPKDLAAVVLAIGAGLMKPNQVQEHAAKAIDSFKKLAELASDRYGATLQDGSSITSGMNSSAAKITAKNEKSPEFGLPSQRDLESLAATCHRNGVDLFPANDPVRASEAPVIAVGIIETISEILTENGQPHVNGEFNITARLLRALEGSSRHE